MKLPFSGERSRGARVFALIFIAPIMFIASIPWLSQQPDMLVYLFAGVAALIAIATSLVFAVINDREQDEWHRVAARFSSQWGWLAGAGLVSLLLVLPPVHDLIYSVGLIFNEIASTSDDSAALDRELVLLTFTFGVITIVSAQTLCTVILRAVWFFRMSRPAK